MHTTPKNLKTVLHSKNASNVFKIFRQHYAEELSTQQSPVNVLDLCLRKLG